MKRISRILAIGIVLAATAGFAHAEVVSELNLGSGYRGNLFTDSNAAGDTYAAAGYRLKYYPSASVEFTGGARYNAFAEYSDLSSLSGDASLTAILTPATSRFTFALNGQAAYRTFGQLYQPYDRASGSAAASLGYAVAAGVHLMGGASYTNSVYTNSDYGSSHGLDLTGGINLTVVGSNSVALRADYTRRWFDQPDISGTGNPTAGTDNSQMFEIIGLTARYSRPLGQRTGLSLSGGYRQLSVAGDYAVLGYTIDYLSPWSDLWEGQSVSASIKHIFPHQVKTEIAAAYYDKRFVDVIELDQGAGSFYNRESRDDILTTGSLTVSRPFLLKSGNLLTPTVSIGYRSNESTADYFDYNDAWGGLSLNVTF